MNSLAGYGSSDEDNDDMSPQLLPNMTSKSGFEIVQLGGEDQPNISFPTVIPSFSFDTAITTSTFLNNHLISTANIDSDEEDDEKPAASSSISSYMQRYKANLSNMNASAEKQIFIADLAQSKSIESFVVHQADGLAGDNDESSNNATDSQIDTHENEDGLESLPTPLSTDASSDDLSSSYSSSYSSTTTTTTDAPTPVPMTLDRRAMKELQALKSNVDSLRTITRDELTMMTKQEREDYELEAQLRPRTNSKTVISAEMWNAQSGQSELTTTASKNIKRKHQITQLAAQADDAHRRLMLKKAQQNKMRHY